MPRRKYIHRHWLPEEDVIVDRYARALAPGVYFARGEGRGAGAEGRTRKVVVQR